MNWSFRAFSSSVVTFILEYFPSRMMVLTSLWSRTLSSHPRFLRSNNWIPTIRLKCRLLRIRCVFLSCFLCYPVVRSSLFSACIFALRSVNCHLLSFQITYHTYFFDSTTPSNSPLSFLVVSSVQDGDIIATLSDEIFDEDGEDCACFPAFSGPRGIHAGAPAQSFALPCPYV